MLRGGGRQGQKAPETRAEMGEVAPKRGLITGGLGGTCQAHSAQRMGALALIGGLRHPSCTTRCNRDMHCATELECALKVDNDFWKVADAY